MRKIIDIVRVIEADLKNFPRGFILDGKKVEEIFFGAYKIEGEEEPATLYNIIKNNKNKVVKTDTQQFKIDIE